MKPFDEKLPTLSLTARWIFPIDGPVLERGIVTVQGERIVAVEPHRTRSADLVLGNVAILPGFVNAHTHLDLTGLRGRVPPSTDFTRWLRSVVQHRRSLSAEQVREDTLAGVRESIAAGVTLVGDISGGGLNWNVLADAPLRAVVFHELLGLPQPRAEAAYAAFLDWLNEHPATSTCRPGVSPHAPYSVRRTLFHESAHIAASHRLPLATHLAETTAELELLCHHRGEFVRFLESLGVWDPEGLVSGPEEVLQLNADVPHALFAHGNFLDPALPMVGTVVFCPRTHAAFQHPPHPFRELLRRGVRVALGTDSLASNPDLSVLEEARFLHRLYPDMSGEVLLRLATLSGAEALGWAEETGSLAPGKSADLVVLPLPNREESDPARLVLASELAVAAVMFRGNWIHGDPTF